MKVLEISVLISLYNIRRITMGGIANNNFVLLDEVFFTYIRFENFDGKHFIIKMSHDLYVKNNCSTANNRKAK
jgi:hypothetical protein